jgi:hypothetical protein
MEGMRTAGFGVLPMLNSSGIDDALLFWRWSPDRAVLDTVAVWGDEYAVWARLPPDREWADPFRPTVGQRGRPVSFADVVRAVQRRPHPRPSGGEPGDEDWLSRDDV